MRKISNTLVANNNGATRNSSSILADQRASIAVGVVAAVGYWPRSILAPGRANPVHIEPDSDSVRAFAMTNSSHALPRTPRRFCSSVA